METNTETKNNIKQQKGIVSAISKLRVVQPQDYNWKQDYIKALEEKYENI
jgi:hypothetical protein